MDVERLKSSIMGIAKLVDRKNATQSVCEIECFIKEYPPSIGLCHI